MGALFRLDVYEDKKEIIINFLKKNNFKIFGSLIVQKQIQLARNLLNKVMNALKFQ